MNIKECWSCHTGVKFQPITNSRGDIIATHSICRSLSCPMNQQDLTAIKLKQKKSTKHSVSVKRTTRRKSRFISGASVGLISLICTFSALTSFANFQLPSSEIIYQQTPVSSSTAPQSAQEAIRRTESVETIKDKILRYSAHYGVNPVEIENIVKCETGAVDVNKASTTIQSRYLEGTPRQELSFGISQIHVSAHKGITKEMAYDVDYSLDFLASHWAKGHQSMWLNCSKKYGYI